jgi:crossover junction endodeoxyribonuclease RusA
LSIVNFTVFGVPQPQGSIRAFMPKGSSKPILTSDNKKMKPWRQDAAWLGKEAMQKAGERLFVKPIAVAVDVTFYFQRPKKSKGCHKTTKPDVDKLLRALLDALTGICYEDDSQVASCIIVKVFDETPRTEVRVSVLESATR